MTSVRCRASPDDDDDAENDENDDETMPKTVYRLQHVVCVSFDSVVDATDEMCLVGFESARRFWPGKIPGTPADYADVFRLLVPCLEESSSFEGALMIRVMAEENLAERTRFRMELKRRKQERLRREAKERAKLERAVTAKQRGKLEEEAEERAAQLIEQRREYRREQVGDVHSSSIVHFVRSCLSIDHYPVALYTRSSAFSIRAFTRLTFEAQLRYAVLHTRR